MKIKKITRCENCVYEDDEVNEKEHRYFNPIKVMKEGKLIYESPGYGRFLKNRPRIKKGNTLVGIVAVGYPHKLGAVEIPDRKTFEMFQSDFGRSWFCEGGTAFLYELPNRAKRYEIKKFRRIYVSKNKLEAILNRK